MKTNTLKPYRGAVVPMITPIAETNFAFDPEFPAYTSSVTERFADVKRLEEEGLPPASSA